MSTNTQHHAAKLALSASLLALLAACGGGQDALLLIPAPPPAPAPAPPPPPPQATGWTAASTVEISAESADQPHVAYNAGGHGMAVWTQFDGAVTNIWAAKFDQASNTWRKAGLVETISTGNAVQPKISVDAAGNAVVVWGQRAGGGFSRWDVFANHYRISTGTWAPTPQKISTNTGDATSPKVVVDASGNAISVWRQADVTPTNGVQFNVWANRYTASTTSWGAPTSIESDDTGSADAPEVAMDSSGNAIAVWSQKVFAWNSILANRFDAGTGLWGMATLVETNDTNNARYPAVAMDANGDAVVVWEHWENRPDKGFIGPSRVASNRFSAGPGTWGTAELIDTAGSISKSVDVTIDGAGSALAVWTQGDDAVANRFNAGAGTWSTSVLIETNDVGPEGVDRVRIAADTVGNAIAVWDQFDGTQINIFANRYSVGTDSWGTAELIETDNTGQARSVRIAKNPSNGNALAVWTQEDGNGLQSILGSHFK
jgi:hypothetical protein